MDWLRTFRNKRLDARDAERLLGAGAMERIQQRVAASEKHHSGEIRVCVEAGLPLSYLWRDASPRQRASPRAASRTLARPVNANNTSSGANDQFHASISGVP